MTQPALARSITADDASEDAAPIVAPPLVAPPATGALAVVETIATFGGRNLGLEVAIEPVTDLVRLAKAGHFVAASLTHGRTGRPLSHTDRMALLASDTERVDLAVLDRALAWLGPRHGQGDSISLIVPVSFLTAASQRARTNLLLRPGPLREAVRTSVIWLLSDLPDGVPAGRLTEVASLLRPFGRAVFAETRLNGAALKAAKAAGIAGLVLAPPKIGLNETDTALWMLQAGKLAGRCAPALIVANLPSANLFAMAEAAGFTHGTLADGVG